MPCSLLIPTYRIDENACVGLETACVFAGKRGIHVRIADNSVNSEKHAFLRSLAAKNQNISVYLHNENIGALNNFIYLLEQSTEDEWIHMAADDDVITWGSLSSSLDIAQEHPDAAAVTGHLIALKKDGTLNAEIHEYLQSLPSERLQHWFSPRSWNLLHYSLIRRSSVQPWINFVKNHPLQAPFFDFLLTTSVVATGPVYNHHKGVYLWHSDNWDSPDINFQNQTKVYANAGLNESFTWLSDMQFAVESASFLLGKYSPVQDPSQRQACAQVMWNQCIYHFTAGIERHLDALNNHWKDYPDFIRLINFFIENKEPISILTLNNFPKVLQHFNANLAVDYQIFQNEMFAN